jgi:glycosyltransferase involved in cell wall biosynthesis
MIVFSHPTGNANVRSASYGLLESNQLHEFHTAIAAFPGSFIDRLGGIRSLGEIRRRRFDLALKDYTRTWPWHEAGRLFAQKMHWSALTRHEQGPFCMDEVYRRFDRHVSSVLRKSTHRGARAIYAYEDGAMTSFRAAHQLGLQCFYDLPIGYWRAAKHFMEIEREKWPEWQPTLIGLADSDHKLWRKDEELRLAHRIFVASSFTARTLARFPGKLPPIEIIPYGFPPAEKQRTYRTGNRGRLKVLFVGGLSQRKGIANLFAAIMNLRPHIDLTIVGQKIGAPCIPLDIELGRHRWYSSLPHQEILALMQQNDVLVFPSLFEGFGLVISESMSQGTPVITTERTAGPDIIEHGNNGWLVDAGSTESLQCMIETLLSNPELLARSGKAALETAQSRPWSIYQQELSKTIAGHLTRSQL